MQSAVSAEVNPQSKAIQVMHVTYKTRAKFEDVVSRLEAQLGRHDVLAYQELVKDPKKAKDVEKIIAAQAGSSGLMIFAIYDHGSLLTIKKGKAQNAKQYIIGNPLVAARMTEHDIGAALYAPLRMLVYQTSDGEVRIEYDLPSSLFGQFGNPDIDVVAKDLDRKMSHLVSGAIN